jgi:hypothetical protein
LRELRLTIQGIEDKLAIFVNEAGNSIHEVEPRLLVELCIVSVKQRSWEGKLTFSSVSRFRAA